MNKYPLLLATILAAGSILQACAPVIVGGAATGISVVHDRRSVGTTLDDQGIELKMMTALSNEEGLRQQGQFSATSYNHVLLLTGQADTEQARMRFRGLADSIPYVKRIVDEVEVGPRAPLGQQTRDVYLTTKVKLELFSVKLPDFDPSRVKIVSEKGIVYLMGIVTQAEADAVVEKVRYVRGVKRVVKVFEYL